MIEDRLLFAWDHFVGAAALIAIIVLAFCVMAGAVKRAEVFRHLAAIVGGAALFIVLPAILLSLWRTMTLWQHLGIVALGIAALLLLGALRRAPRSTKRRRNSPT